MFHQQLQFWNGADGWYSLIVFISPHHVNVLHPNTSFCAIKVHKYIGLSYHFPPNPLPSSVTVLNLGPTNERKVLAQREYQPRKGDPPHLQAVNYRMIFGLTWFQGCLSHMGSAASWVTWESSTWKETDAYVDIFRCHFRFFVSVRLVKALVWNIFTSFSTWETFQLMLKHANLYFYTYIYTTIQKTFPCFMSIFFHFMRRQNVDYLRCRTVLECILWKHYSACACYLHQNRRTLELPLSYSKVVLFICCVFFAG